jgi:DNA-binding NarL/FixJ family response regulator
LLIADDHRMFREGLAAVLPPAEFEVVGQVEDGQSAVRMARKLEPDMALLDITMPLLNGVEAAREIRKAVPHCRPVIVSMHCDAPYVGESLRAGARGYVIKSQPASELIGALLQVLRGEVYLPPRMAQALPELLHSLDDLHSDPLTAREREVLQLIAEGRTTKEIASVLGISFKTAESHRTHLMRKLDIHETAGLVRYAIRRRMIEV